MIRSEQIILLLVLLVNVLLFFMIRKQKRTLVQAFTGGDNDHTRMISLLGLIAAAVRELGISANVQNLVGRFLSRLLKSFGAEFGAIWLYQPQRQEFNFYVGVKFPREVLPNELLLEGLREHFFRVLSSGRIQILTREELINISTLPSFLKTKEHIIIPLSYGGGNSLGVLHIVAKEKAFSPAHSLFFNFLGQIIALVFMHNEVKNTAKAIEQQLRLRSSDYEKLARNFYKLSQSMTTVAQEEQIIGYVMQTIAGFLDYDLGIIYLPGRKQPGIFLTYINHLVSEDLIVRAKEAVNMEIAELARIDTDSVTHRSIVSSAAEEEAEERKETRFSFCQPLRINKETVGVLGLFGSQDKEISPVERELIFSVINFSLISLLRLGEAIDRHRARLEAIIQGMIQGIVLIDTEKKIQLTNPKAAEYIELLNASIKNGRLISIGNIMVEAIVNDILSGKKPFKTLELQGKDEVKNIFKLIIYPLKEEKNERISGAVILINDITKEKLLQEKFLQAEKLYSVGQLVSGVAHELNNPLTAIIGYAQLLRQMGNLPAEARADIEKLETEALRAGKITQNLLTFARKHRPEKRPVNINKLIENILDLCAYELKVNNIKVVKDLDDALPLTMADYNQLQSVFLNITTNAYEIMAQADGFGVLTIKTRSKGELLQVTFTDTGPGISSKHLRRVFDPFFTTKEVGKGPGLGLSLAYAIIKEHGGNIYVQSEEGKGATFIIDLPILSFEEEAGGKPMAAAKITLTKDCLKHKSGKIIVIDDEPVIGEMIKNVFSGTKIEVEVVESCSEALKRLKTNSYQLILCDIKMPGLDGRAFYRIISHKYPHLVSQFVFLTGDVIGADTSDFLEKAKIPFIAKPFDINQFLTFVSPYFSLSSALK